MFRWLAEKVKVKQKRQYRSEIPRNSLERIVGPATFAGGAGSFTRLERVPQEVRRRVGRLKTSGGFYGFTFPGFMLSYTIQRFFNAYFSFEKFDQSMLNPGFWLYLETFVKGGSLPGFFGNLSGSFCKRVRVVSHLPKLFIRFIV
jgi:hypothetical protein